MSVYDDLQAVARDVLSDPELKQGIIYYVDVVPGSGPVDEPGAPTETPYELTGGTANGVSFKYVQQGLAIASDLQIIAPVDPRFTPNMRGFILTKDKSTDAGVRFKIVEIMKKPAVGTTVAFLFIIRRGTP